MLPPIADSCSLCCLCCLRLPIQLPPAAYATSDCRFSRLLLFMLPPIADSAAFCYLCCLRLPIQLPFAALMPRPIVDSAALYCLYAASACRLRPSTLLVIEGIPFGFNSSIATILKNGCALGPAQTGQIVKNRPPKSPIDVEWHVRCISYRFVSDPNGPISRIYTFFP